MNELPSKAAGVIAQFPATSVSIDVFSDGVIESVKNGEADPLAIQSQIRAMERAFKRILSEINQEVLTAADKYPGTEFEFMGNKITKGSVKTEYDYTVCKDEVWEQLDVDVNTATEKRKDRETWLRAMKTPTPVIDSNGEAVTLQPPLKKETPGIKISIR